MPSQQPRHGTEAMMPPTATNAAGLRVSCEFWQHLRGAMQGASLASLAALQQAHARWRAVALQSDAARPGLDARVAKYKAHKPPRVSIPASLGYAQWYNVGY